MYSELAYFDGYHFAHIAAWQEERRLAGIRARNTTALRSTERRRGGRTLALRFA